MDNLRHAVTDGPDGHDGVVLPEERWAAIRARNENKFWCSRLAGGCGEHLNVAAGEIRRPYFRHPAGSAEACALERDPRRAVATYRHLAIQCALEAWLRDQGHQSDVEYALPVGGRADLHVVVGENEQTIEVQLSPLPEHEWSRRDRLYRSQVEAVTWLYGDGAEARAAAEVVSRSVALQVQAEVKHDEWSVLVGTRGILGTQWCALSECLLTSAGVWTPHIDEARDRTAEWRAGQEALRRREAEYVDRARRSRTEGRRHRQRSWQDALSVAEPLPPIPVTRAGRFAWTLQDQLALHPQASEWSPRQGWAWLRELPGELHEAARLHAYIATVIDGQGPVESLAFDDVADPDQLVAKAPHRAALIVVERTPEGRLRWERTRPPL